MDRYTVYKNTGTHADVLAAIGAADVLRHLDPQIVNFDDRFEIQLRRSLTRGDLTAVDPGFSYLQLTSQKAPNLPAERIVHAKQEVQLDSEPDCAPAPIHRMYSIVAKMKAYTGPNKVIQLFSRMKRDIWEAMIWDCFHGTRSLAFSSPLVQLFNPQAAKGFAFLKPRGTNRNDKTKDRWAEPFLEWLRFRGYFKGSAEWFATGDIRLYCPIPSNIPYAHLASVGSAFRDLKLDGTSAKMDCRAVLGLTRLLIERGETPRRPNSLRMTTTCPAIEPLSRTSALRPHSTRSTHSPRKKSDAVLIGNSSRRLSRSRYTISGLILSTIRRRIPGSKISKGTT